MAEAQNHAPSSREAGHELSDLSPKGMAYFGLGLAVVIIAVLFAMYGLFAWYRSADARRQAPLNPMAGTLEPPPGPNLLVQPGRELATVRRQARERLTTYGWIDPERGIVHIPIERAMDLLAERKLPAREAIKNGGQSAERAAGNAGAARENTRR